MESLDLWKLCLVYIFLHIQLFFFYFTHEGQVITHGVYHLFNVLRCCRGAFVEAKQISDGANQIIGARLARTGWLHILKEQLEISICTHLFSQSLIQL